MSNAYATTAQFYILYDVRTVAQLSNDANSSEAVATTIQTLLDMQASELESSLYGFVGLPLTVTPIPLVLTKWVCATTARRLFGRRNDLPKQVQADSDWAEHWIELFRKNLIQIPFVSRQEVPALQDSDFVDGRSRFDGMMGGCPSPTGPTSSGGQNITG